VRVRAPCLVAFLLSGCLAHREWHPARSRDRLMDNSALSARHTPRLNRFIETLRDAVLELGGTWAAPEADPSYQPMVHPGGILLDYSAAKA